MAYKLSCHCNTIRFTVEHELDDLAQCNCSTCRRFGSIHWYVPANTVSLESESVGLTSYAWRYLHENHMFCPKCGTSVMRTGYPNGVVAINACCIEEVDIFALEPRQIDGRGKIPPGVLR